MRLAAALLVLALLAGCQAKETPQAPTVALEAEVVQFIPGGSKADYPYGGEGYYDTTKFQILCPAEWSSKTLTVYGDRCPGFPEGLHTVGTPMVFRG